MTGDGTYTYQYDAEGRLVTVMQGSTTVSTATFNALGEQVRRVITNGLIDLTYDPSGRTAGFFDGSAGAWWERQFWAGGRLLGEYDYGTNFIHHSNVGSPNPTLITDASGGPHDGDEIFYPWGQQWQYDDGGGWWQYYGGFSRYEGDLDRYLTPNRFYSSGIGRWLTPDKLGGDVTNPQSLNRYAYVVNNPATLTDPLGLDPYAGNPGDPCSDPAYADSNASCGWNPCWGLTPEAWSQSNCGGLPAVIGGGGGGSVLPPVPPAGQPPLGGENFAGLPPCINYNALIPVIAAMINKELHPVTPVTVTYSGSTQGGAPEFTINPVSRGNPSGETSLWQPLKGSSAKGDIFHHAPDGKTLADQASFPEPKDVVPGAGSVLHILYNPVISTTGGAVAIKDVTAHFDILSPRNPLHFFSDVAYARIVSAIEGCGQGGIKFQ